MPPAARPGLAVPSFSLCFACLRRLGLCSVAVFGLKTQTPLGIHCPYRRKGRWVRVQTRLGGGRGGDPKSQSAGREESPSLEKFCLSLERRPFLTDAGSFGGRGTFSGFLFFLFFFSGCRKGSTTQSAKGIPDNESGHSSPPEQHRGAQAGGRREKEGCRQGFGEHKLTQPFWKEVWQSVSRTFKALIPFDTVILVLGIRPKEII